MKQSKRNLRNAVAKAESRKSGPPKVSKYASKRAKQIVADDEPLSNHQQAALAHWDRQRG